MNIDTLRHKYSKTPIGLIGKVSDLATPDRLFDLAIFKLKNIKGLASRAMIELERLVCPGGRIVFFSDDYLKSADIVSACQTWGFDLEQVLVWGQGKQATKLFERSHELVFILRKDGKDDRPRNAAKVVSEHLNGYPSSVLHGDLAFLTGILVRAYTTPGDLVLCPTGGTEFIAGSLDWGCETHYLAKDQEALAYYSKIFGGNSNQQ